MDIGLFAKYAVQINTQKSKVSDLLACIKDVSGIEILEDEVSLQKNTVIFTVSSVLRSKLMRKEVIEALTKGGYIVKGR
jgi:hypothetical protein